MIKVYNMLYLKCIVNSLLKNGYAVFAGLERIRNIWKLEFSESDIVI